MKNSIALLLAQMDIINLIIHVLNVLPPAYFVQAKMIVKNALVIIFCLEINAKVTVLMTQALIKLMKQINVSHVT